MGRAEHGAFQCIFCGRRTALRGTCSVSRQRWGHAAVYWGPLGNTVSQAAIRTLGDLSSPDGGGGQSNLAYSLAVLPLELLWGWT